ncbi:MAG: D-alanyl-D-alanine carboxypeptidase [Bdellovibrionaceae bacterium]|nr:D-alanyl-D-alanine carboxypeptidase [Pseudobdellovibrionaceae bacterium]
MRSLFLVTLLFANLAFAKSSLNSMCYIESKSGAKIQGENTQSLFEIASVSKVFTSFWALNTLGADFRFKTKVFLTPVSGSTYDVHIQGSMDPYFGRQLTHFLFSELNRYGVQNIRQLTFDENFKTRWNVLTDFLETLSPSNDDIVSSFQIHAKRLSSEYPATVNEALRSRIVLPGRLNLTIDAVSFLPSAQFKPGLTMQGFTLSSSPLHRYLKEMNRVSNNHVADKLFEYLGGTTKFMKFVKETMELSNANLQFVNGSGNSVVVGTTNNGGEIKEYNKASCETLIRVMIALQNTLRAQGFDMKDVMAVSRSDDSTLRPRYDAMPGSVIAKTGTVDPAIALAGMVSTADGDVYFGYLYKTDSAADWNSAKDNIRNRVFDLVRKFGGLRSVDYTPVAFLSFDANSYFTPINLASLRRP